MDTMNDILHPRENDAADPNFPNAPPGWSRDVAAQTASKEGLKTSTDHWTAVRALQEEKADLDKTYEKNSKLNVKYQKILKGIMYTI